MKKKNYSQEILIISVLTLTITFLWLYLSVYQALHKSEKTIVEPKEIELLVPKLDQGVFDELKKKQL